MQRNDKAKLIPYSNPSVIFPAIAKTLGSAKRQDLTKTDLISTHASRE